MSHALTLEPIVRTQDGSPRLVAVCSCGAKSTFSGRLDKVDLFASLAPKQAVHWHAHHVGDKSA